jgi:hypothetical protein
MIAVDAMKYESRHFDNARLYIEYPSFRCDNASKTVGSSYRRGKPHAALEIAAEAYT